jgi:hypothetical protein
MHREIQKGLNALLTLPLSVPTVEDFQNTMRAKMDCYVSAGVANQKSR